MVLNPQQVNQLVVDEESAGQRIDNFLFRYLKGVPKSHVYRIIRSGEVRLNKGRVSAEDRVADGDVVRIPPLRMASVPAAVATEPAAPPREFPVLYEDDQLLALNKPAGVAVHGGSGLSWGVIEQLRRARPQAPLLELVHRLDRETSGILLVAKKRSALRKLQDQFRERETQKTYLALVEGHWPASRKLIDLPLQKYLLKDGERRVKVVSPDHPDAMRSISLVRVVSHGSWANEKTLAVNPTPVSLLAVTIKTGRTHQIRVHLASCGHPIAGDDKYGNFDWNRELARSSLKRMFLHAWKLGFAHPQTGASLHLEAKLPTELECVVNRTIFPDASDYNLDLLLEPNTPL